MPDKNIVIYSKIYGKNIIEKTGFYTGNNKKIKMQ
jgi:hypothetical protein